MKIENGWEIFRDALAKADMDPDDDGGRVQQSTHDVRIYIDGWQDSLALFIVGLCEAVQEVDGGMDLAWDLARNMQVNGSTLVFPNTDLGLDESKCGICGEQSDNEMGEFIAEGGSSVLAHGQCGIDKELELA